MSEDKKTSFVIDVSTSAAPMLLKSLVFYRLTRKLAIEAVPGTVAAHIAKIPRLPDAPMDPLQFSPESLAREGWQRDWRFGKEPFSPVVYRSLQLSSSSPSPLPSSNNDPAANLGQKYYDTLRLACGIVEGEDVPLLEALPLECGIDLMGGVHFSKGCYLGQELTARTKHTGVLRRRIAPFVALDGQGEKIIAEPLASAAATKQANDDGRKGTGAGDGGKGVVGNCSEEREKVEARAFEAVQKALTLFNKCKNNAASSSTMSSSLLNQTASSSLSTKLGAISVGSEVEVSGGEKNGAEELSRRSPGKIRAFDPATGLGLVLVREAAENQNNNNQMVKLSVNGIRIVPFAPAYWPKELRDGFFGSSSPQ